MLEAALADHLAGRLEQAEAGYRKVLDLHPLCADALHLLGVVANQRGDDQAAVDSISRAIALNRGIAEFYSNRGNALRALGRLDEAVRDYEVALSLKPQYPDAHSNLGVALKEQGKSSEARRCYEEALTLQPDHPKALTNLGVVLLEEGRTREAIHLHRRALALNPREAEAHANLGNALRKEGRAEAAIECYRTALALRPQRAAEVYNNLGAMLKEQAKLEEAIECYHRALELSPKLAEAYSNLGAARKEQNRTPEAILCYEKALELEPGFVVARWNRSLALLLSGELDEGWAEYDCGWGSEVRKPERPFTQPLWRGEPLAGSKILIWGEQGLGDEMIFASVFPDVVAAASGCVIECTPRLTALFARSFPGAEIVPRTDPPHPGTEDPGIAWKCPAGSLPRWFRGRVDCFPRHSGYLKADPEEAGRWRERLAQRGDGLKVGICWRSMLQTATRSLEYTRLEQWGPIFGVPGVTFINLQYDDCRAELDQVRSRFGIQVHTWDDVDLMNDLDRAAALMMGLDLVISAGTAVSAMAGALGKPVWQYTLVSSADWLALGTDYVPWFPSMRRFDRRHGQTWDEVIARVAGELSLAASPGP